MDTIFSNSKSIGTSDGDRQLLSLADKVKIKRK